MFRCKSLIYTCTVLKRFSSNSEAKASELLDNIGRNVTEKSNITSVNRWQFYYSNEKIFIQDFIGIF